MSLIVNIVVIGPGAVGKSALSIRYAHNQFVEIYEPTLEDSYRKQTQVDGEEVVMEIIDTAGQDPFSSVRDHNMRRGDGFLCVYSIIDKQTFHEAAKLYEHLLLVKEMDSVPLVLVGNKCDKEENREVTKEQGIKLSSAMHCPFFETSALSRINVNEAFEELVRQIKSVRKNSSRGEMTKEVHEKDVKPGSGRRKQTGGRRRCIIL